MTAIWLGVIGAFKYILLKVLTEKFLIWVTLHGARALAKSTKTKFDDKLVKQVTEAVYGTDTKSDN